MKHIFILYDTTSAFIADCVIKRHSLPKEDCVILCSFIVKDECTFLGVPSHGLSNGWWHCPINPDEPVTEELKNRFKLWRDGIKQLFNAVTGGDSCVLYSNHYGTVGSSLFISCPECKAINVLDKALLYHMQTPTEVTRYDDARTWFEETDMMCVFDTKLAYYPVYHPKFSKIFTFDSDELSEPFKSKAVSLSPLNIGEVPEEERPCVFFLGDTEYIATLKDTFYAKCIDQLKVFIERSRINRPIYVYCYKLHPITSDEVRKSLDALYALNKVNQVPKGTNFDQFAFSKNADIYVISNKQGKWFQRRKLNVFCVLPYLTQHIPALNTDPNVYQFFLEGASFIPINDVINIGDDSAN